MKAKTKALAGWFGGARMIAEHVGEALRGCSWVGVPFAGGMSELLHIDASSILVSDKHRHIINLARIVKDKERRKRLIEEADLTAVHPDELRDSQIICKVTDNPQLDFDAALAYFVCCWMGQGGRAGTAKEFQGSFSFRWDAGGGDSAKRFRSATESLAAWDQVMPRCTFVCLDVFEFLVKVKDVAGHGLYCDPPWPSDGGDYLHTFSEAQHRQLASKLADFRQCRVVVRYGDHYLIRELYPESRWNWQEIDGRTQANKAKAEVLITRRAA